MEETKIIINENYNSEQLKLKFKNKLKDVKAKLEHLKIKLTKNIASHSSDIPKNYGTYISNLKSKAEIYINNKEQAITNKEALSYDYSKFIRNLKDIEKFNKNLSDILINSLENYNNFLISSVPYYKESSAHFIINNGYKLVYNNIFCKLNQNQINKITDTIKNKNILYLINDKFSLNINISTQNILLNKSLLDSISKYEIKRLQLNDLRDEDFELIFNRNNFYDNLTLKQNEIIFQNCEFKKADLSEIPFDINNFKIMNSKVSSFIFEKIQFSNLKILILDNCKLDSESFENIFKILLKNDSKIYNNLKILSARNNTISRIIKTDELKCINDKFNVLEILNLSSNLIYDVDKILFDYIPNIKILDLSNNGIIQEYKCKEIIKNCKGLVLLLRNIGIMRDSINKYYRDYYIEKLEKNEYPFYSLDLESLYYKRNYENILSINFSNIKNNFNIFELNLSSCCIDDHSMIKIILKCIPINNNIAKINLSFNSLTDNFFNLVIEKNIFFIFNNVLELDLSFNPIKFPWNKNNSLEKNPFLIFLNNFNKIALLSLKGTPFEEKFNDYIYKEVNRFYEIEKKHPKITEILNEFQEIKLIIEKDYLEVNSNFYIIINDLLKPKYNKNLKKVLPKFLNHIIVDNLRCD